MKNGEDYLRVFSCFLVKTLLTSVFKNAIMQPVAKIKELVMSQKTVQTIEDIARLANVSKSTVSRALNDSPLIKQETRQRIQAIAREHNFRINAPARNLSMRQ